ncbi:MAG: DNA mismatch repair protein MutS [Flavobacteriaceae bacterium]
MERLVQFYTEEKGRLETELKAVKNKLTNLSVLRLIVFLLTSGGIYFFFDDLMIAGIIAAFGIILFWVLLMKYLDTKEEKELLVTKIEINVTEIKVQQGDFSFLKTGEEFIDGTHVYSNDIDLFGRGSFFQYLNRTATDEGAQKLANTLTENKITEIVEKQEGIKDLSKKVQWRQHFSALAGLVKVQHSSKVIVDFIQNYQSVFSKVVSLLPLVFSLTSLLLITLTSFQIISFTVLTIWFFIGLGITGRFIKKTQNIYTKAGKSKDTFKQYHQLLQEIENIGFTSEILKRKQTIIQSEDTKASTIFMKFSRILDAFDQRNNLFVVLIGNAFFLWDLRNACKVEKWILTYKHTVEKWFEVITFFDAQNSLANFHYNHPEYSFPKIGKENAVIKSVELGHPLLNSEKRIDNDFNINDQEFYIITGANMAGKSTFLRTVSLSIVMANVGLPVCAKEFEYSPIKLITSMRTSDSLADDESYFYSELKRLKFIVDTIDTDEYFIILDEILKGTNSKDKAIGSKKFVEKLVSSKSTGIIATHDVSLCELENDFSEIKNYYFDAEITNDELYFDYLFKKGVCKNMNASFLLKKMKIV